MLYVDEHSDQVKKPRIAIQEVCAFGEQEPTNDDFATNDSKFTFDDPLKIEQFQRELIDCLGKECDAVVGLTMDLAVKGLWPLLIGMLNICDMDLKMACLNLMSSMV